MKNLYLNEFLRVIGGKLIKGNPKVLLTKLITCPHSIKDNTLCFDLFRYRDLDISYFNIFKNYVFITNRTGDFEGLNADGTIVEVEDIHKAYWRFVEYYRNILSIPIIGVAGTCGKTTTKEMIKHILSVKYNVCSTYKSNNVIQFNSMYLLKSSGETQFGVFEMGLNKPGDLSENCKYLKPQIRVLLNIGVYHLEGCSTPEAYIKAKSEIIEGLEGTEDILIINGDDSNIKKIDVSGLKRVLKFGFDEANDIKAANVSYGEGGMGFTISFEGKTYDVYVPGYGRHNVYNAMAAIAASVSAGIEIKEAIENLRSFKPVIEHQQFKTGKGGCIVIDDTWSSAPPSVEAALNVLKDVALSKKKAAIIGISPLLGVDDHAINEYRKLGEKVVECDVDLLIVAGKEAAQIGVRAIELGMDKGSVHYVNSDEEIYNILKAHLNYETVILLKVTYRQITKEAFSKLKLKLGIE